MKLILRVHHADIVIGRGQEALAREFYCNFLGFKEIPKPLNLQKNGGLWLELSGVQIHLSVQDGFDPSKTKSHIAYEVSNLASLKEAMVKREIIWTDGTPFQGFIRGEIRDPFGNRIEFLQAL